MQVGWLLRRRQAFRIGHRDEVAVVCGAQPARARRIGAELGDRTAAGERLGRALNRARRETLAVGGKTRPIELRILFGARADPMTCERLLMRVDERHAMSPRIGTARSARALYDRLELRQEARAGEMRDLAQPLSVELERRMHVETRLPARAR